MYLPSTHPEVGQVLTVRLADGDAPGIVIAGPYSPGFPGEEWMVVPIVPADHHAEADELALASTAGRLAAAWASQSLPRRVLGGALGRVSAEELDALVQLVFAIEDGRVAAPVASDMARDRLLARWFAAAMSELPDPEAEPAQVLGMHGFLQRQMHYFACPVHAAPISAEDLQHLGRLLMSTRMAFQTTAVRPDRPLGAFTTGSHPVAPTRTRLVGCTAALERAG